MSKVKKASIKKLKSFKTAFGENCDVFSNNSFEIVPRIKEDNILKRNKSNMTDVFQQNEGFFLALKQFIKLVKALNC